VHLTLDPVYQRAREACMKAVIARYNQRFKDTQEVPTHPGGPGEIDRSILNAVPAYARVARYQQAREAVTVAQMGHAVLPREAAASLTATLIADTPAIRAALAARQPATSSRMAKAVLEPSSMGDGGSGGAGGI
jgi:hypothetical protein